MLKCIYELIMIIIAEYKLKGLKIIHLLIFLRSICCEKVINMQYSNESLSKTDLRCFTTFKKILKIFTRGGSVWKEGVFLRSFWFVCKMSWNFASKKNMYFPQNCKGFENWNIQYSYISLQNLHRFIWQILENPNVWEDHLQQTLTHQVCANWQTRLLVVCGVCKHNNEFLLSALLHLHRCLVWCWSLVSLSTMGIFWSGVCLVLVYIFWSLVSGQCQGQD